MKLCEFLKIEAGTMQIDWENVEKHMGFAIHKDLKDFYSRNTGKDIEGTVNFVQKKFIEKTGNKRNDTWFSFNRCEGTVHYKLNLLSAKHKTFADAVDYVFSVWTGGNDFGHRAFLGTLSVKMGKLPFCSITIREKSNGWILDTAILMYMRRIPTEYWLIPCRSFSINFQTKCRKSKFIVP